MKKNKDTYVIVAALAVLAIMRRNKSIKGMSDPIVSIDNIRRGVRNGWYAAQLERYNGAPAVRLSGKRTDGTYESSLYPITEADWQQLKSENYPVV